MSSAGGRWGRLLAEGLLIVASVYLAIFLEGLSQEADRRAEARVGLEQLVAELRLDLQDVDRVRGFQEERVHQYQEFLRLLQTPEGPTLDSIAAMANRIASGNWTLYPRKGGWTTLRDGGLLSHISDRGLAVRIADHYENRTARIEDNGALYDREWGPSVLYTLTEADAWVELGRVDDVEKLRSRTRFFEETWTSYYAELIAEYGEQIEELVGEIDRHLATR